MSTSDMLPKYQSTPGLLDYSTLTCPQPNSCKVTLLPFRHCERSRAYTQCDSTAHSMRFKLRLDLAPYSLPSLCLCVARYPMPRYMSYR
eukprot:3463292-Rhodomonas_salina.1